MSGLLQIQVRCDSDFDIASAVMADVADITGEAV